MLYFSLEILLSAVGITAVLCRYLNTEKPGVYACGCLGKGQVGSTDERLCVLCVFAEERLFHVI